jgi:hypothetical protein
VNRAANVDRDSPARAARRATVHGCSGCWWISPSASASAVSPSAQRAAFVRREPAHVVADGLDDDDVGQPDQQRLPARRLAVPFQRHDLEHRREPAGGPPAGGGPEMHHRWEQVDQRAGGRVVEPQVPADHGGAAGVGGGQVGRRARQPWRRPLRADRIDQVYGRSGRVDKRVPVALCQHHDIPGAQRGAAGHAAVEVQQAAAVDERVERRRGPGRNADTPRWAQPDRGVDGRTQLHRLEQVRQGVHRGAAPASGRWTNG